MTLLGPRVVFWSPSSVINGVTWCPEKNGRKSLGNRGLSENPEIHGVTWNPT